MGSTHDDHSSSRACRDGRDTARSRARAPAALAARAAGVGVFEWHARTGELVCSEEFAALYGWTLATAPRAYSDWLQRVHPQDRPGLARAMRTALRARGSFELDYRVVQPGGGERWVRARGRALHDARGRVRRILGIGEDLTAHRDLEDEHRALLRRERELRVASECANHSKDKLLARFSHELRSPLNAILGWNRILAVKRPGDADVATMTERIERSAKAQLKMVNDLLDSSRIHSGKLQIEPRPVKLASIVCLGLDAIRAAAETKGIELLYSSEGTNTEVYADPERLRQVVDRLLSNALKFTDSGGHIEVKLRARDVSVELSVSDTGRGIDADQLPHLFTRLRRGARASARGTGLGIGLALVREIVALHNGSITVASGGAGQGSTFTVHLPAQHARSVGPAAGAPDGRAPRPLAGLAILVVDDEPDARTVVAETLRLEGAEVRVSDSVADAWAKLAAQGARYDVVVTDIGMPAEDGYSLVRKLRAMRSGEAVIAIALTGYVSPRDRDAAMDAGFDLHVAKPVDFDDFILLISRMAQPRSP